jgi:uncharacterized protein YraI
MKKTVVVSVLLVTSALALGLLLAQTAHAEEVVCGQWRLANCPFNGANTPVFLPCGTTQPWVVDAMGAYSLFQNGQFVRLYSPRVTYNEGFVCDGQKAGYLWTVARTEQISSCAACQPIQNNPPSGYTPCSGEGQRCNFDGTKDVAYGANGQFNYKYGVTGGVDCNNATFGDPISGVGKACYIKPSASAPAPTPIPPPTPARPAPTAITEPNVQVRSTGANLRSGPGTNYSVVGSAGAGAQLRITGKNPASDWWQICCVGGQEAWVAAWIVDTFGPLWQVPVVAQPSPAPISTRSAPTATPVQGSCLDIYEPNDNYRYREIQPGEMRATLCPQSDVDVYKLSVWTGSQVIVRLDSLPADFDLAIFDGQGNELATSENGGNDPEEITWKATSDGNILVGIWGYNGASSTQSYRLTTRLMTQNLNAHQIRFNIKDSTFRQLEIVGQDQYGQVVSWRTGDGKRELLFAETKDWWWQGTIVLTFEDTKRGWRRCVIDYLKESSSDSWVPVMYTESQGCSGDAGSGQSGRVFVEQLDKVLNNEEDSLKLLGAIDGVSDRWQCTKALVDGFRSTPVRGVIRVGKECADIALEAARAILQKYDKGLEIR